MDARMTPCPTFDPVIGLDRSDTKADLYLIDTHPHQESHETVDTAPEAFLPWLDALRQRYPKARVALCLEQPAGNLMALLEPFAWITL